MDDKAKARVAALLKTEARLEKEMAAAAKRAAAAEGELAALQKGILELGGPRLKRQQAKVDLAAKAQDEAVALLNKAGVDRAAEEKKAAKAAEAQGKKAAELEEAKAKFEATQADFKALEEEAFQVMQAYEAAKAEAEAKKGELGALTAEWEALKKEVATVRAVEVDLLSDEELLDEIVTLEAERDRLKAEVNMGALAAYRKKEAEFREKAADLEAVTQERNAARAEHEALRRRRLEEFMAGFGRITLKLKEMYQMITLGGDAELELVDSLDPFAEGVVFSVRPPKKSWKNIANLSGGEKTLSSLALVFALHHYKPTPLYVMDEIDAALDFKNVSIVANYIKERTKNAQFIIISLRNNMFELADRLVGIYKVDNVTNSVTINPKVVAALGQQQRAAPPPAQEEEKEEHTTKKTNNRRRKNKRESEAAALTDRTNLQEQIA